MILDVPDFLLDVQNVVTFYAGGESFSISRALIKYHSSHLDDSLDGENALFFPDFSQVPRIFEQCVNLLKGLEVTVDMENFGGFLKFSVLNKVETMYEKLLDWLDKEYQERNISFMKIYKFARKAIRFDRQRVQILDHCKNLLATSGIFIIENELTHIPVDTFDVQFIDLLIDASYIWITLPFLKQLVFKQSRAEMILPAFNNDAIISSLAWNAEFTTDFLPHISCILAESEPKHLLLLIKIQAKVFQVKNQLGRRNFPLLEPDIFLESPVKRNKVLSLPAKDILELKQQMSLREIVFCDLVLAWLKANDTSVKKICVFVRKFWEKIDLTKLSQGFLHDLRRHLTSICSGHGGDVSLDLPGKDSRSQTCDFDGFGFKLTQHAIRVLKKGYPVTLTHHCPIAGCEADNKLYGVCFQLANDFPCYSIQRASQPPQTHQHTIPPHFWLSFNGYEMVSLVTNKHSDILEMLSSESVARVYVSCMLDIRDNPVLESLN